MSSVSEDFPPLQDPNKPPKPPDAITQSPPPAVNITEEQDTVPREGFAAATSKLPTKFIEINLFKIKSESSSLFQLSQEEKAKLIQRLNINPKQLFSISAHEPTRLDSEVDERLDLSLEERGY